MERVGGWASLTHSPHSVILFFHSLTHIFTHDNRIKTLSIDSPLTENSSMYEHIINSTNGKI